LKSAEVSPRRVCSWTRSVDSWDAEEAIDETLPDCGRVVEVLELPDGVDVVEVSVGAVEPDGDFETVVGDPELVELHAESDAARKAPITSAVTRAVNRDLDPAMDIRPRLVGREQRSIMRGHRNHNDRVISTRQQRCGGAQRFGIDQSRLGD
jgi:hypothetical protein